MSQELVVVNEQELATKKNAWSNFGAGVYTTEIEIQNMAIKAKADIVHPTKIGDIPEAEVKLKALKSAMSEITEKRKKVTTVITDLSKRLMEPEKSLEEPIKALEASMISVKKAEEAIQKAKQDKAEEGKRIIEFFKNAVTQFDANCKTIINDKINKAYEYALGDGDVKPIQKDSYLEKVCATINESTFPMPNVSGRKAVFHSAEEVNALQAEHFKVDRDEYVALFANEIETKFFDFEVAFNNKEHALAEAKKQKEQRDQEIADERLAQQTSNKIESVAETPIEVTVATKALKKSYAIDMPETVETALAIQAAFISNLKLCLPKVRVTKWFDFKVSQAGDALAKVKCDDNNFQPSGIIFKEVEKL